jgi:hypothetical protein
MTRPAKTVPELRAEARARAQQRSSPLDDYDPLYLEQAGVRGGGTAATVRGIPAGWLICRCGKKVCPDKRVER